MLARHEAGDRGPAPDKEGLWLAQMIDDEEPAVDLAPYWVGRSECLVELAKELQRRQR